MIRELNIQKVLRAGTSFEEIEETYGIKARVSIDGKLVNLKYSQIKSDKHLPIVHECRGIILEMGTWDVVARGFERFFNYGEDVRNWDHVDFNSPELAVYEKVDGSIITVFNYEGNWRISTSGIIDAHTDVNGGVMTFRQLFDSAVEKYDNFWNALDESHIYVFELVSPYNRVVTEYPNADVRLLSVRIASTMSELNPSDMEAVTPHFIKTAKRFDVESLEEILIALDKLPYKDEGFVIVDYSQQNVYGNYARVKMKTEEYVRLHHLKDSVSASPKRLVEVVLENEGDEVSATFPELKNDIDVIKTLYINFKKRLVRSWEDVAHLHLPDMSKEEIATYAKAVMKDHKEYSWILFKMRSQGIRDVYLILDNIISNERECKLLIERIADEYINFLKKEVK